VCGILCGHLDSIVLAAELRLLPERYVYLLSMQGRMQGVGVNAVDVAVLLRFFMVIGCSAAAHLQKPQ